MDTAKWSRGPDPAGGARHIERYLASLTSAANRVTVEPISVAVCSACPSQMTALGCGHAGTAARFARLDQAAIEEIHLRGIHSAEPANDRQIDGEGAAIASAAGTTSHWAVKNAMPSRAPSSTPSGSPKAPSSVLASDLVV